MGMQINQHQMSSMVLGGVKEMHTDTQRNATTQFLSTNFLESTLVNWSNWSNFVNNIVNWPAAIVGETCLGWCVTGLNLQPCSCQASFLTTRCTDQYWIIFLLWTRCSRSCAASSLLSSHPATCLSRILVCACGWGGEELCMCVYVCVCLGRVCLERVVFACGRLYLCGGDCVYGVFVQGEGVIVYVCICVCMVDCV